MILEHEDQSCRSILTYGRIMSGSFIFHTNMEASTKQELNCRLSNLGDEKSVMTFDIDKSIYRIHIKNIQNT